VAIANGTIIALDEAALELRGPATSVLDLPGATLTPGLVDGHTHPLLGAEGFVGLDLSGCRTLDDLRDALSVAVRGLIRGEWLRGYALDYNVFDGAPIDRALIEDVLDGVPTFLRVYDGHSALVNGAALDAAGITGPRRFDQRSEIVCDPVGRPTGHLLEHAAMQIVADVVPPMPVAERRERTMSILRAMAASGLTGGHVMDGTDESIELLTGLEEDADLPLRLRLAPWCMPGVELDHLVEAQRRAGRRWAVRAVKFFIDGTIEGGTAWLQQPDCHGENTDAFWMDPAEYTKAVQHFDAAGVQTATHAIGDAGVMHVLDTLEDLPPGAVRHRIEHLETLPLAQAVRLARVGAVASMQPSHSAYTKADHSDEWSTRLGDERANRAWCCRDLRDAGATLVLGSDWPVANFDAREVLSYARLRRHADTDTTPVLPQQGLTGLMALEGMTSAAADVAGESAYAGRIAPGFRADLTAFAVDPVTAPADEVGQAPIRLTMTAGEVTHQS
jgi:hypothetical protein